MIHILFVDIIPPPPKQRTIVSQENSGTSSFAGGSLQSATSHMAGETFKEIFFKLKSAFNHAVLMFSIVIVCYDKKQLKACNQI